MNKGAFSPSGTRTRRLGFSGSAASLFLALGLVLAAGPAAHAVQLTLPQIEASPGERVRIPVSITDVGADEILSANLDIRFDAIIVPPSGCTCRLLDAAGRHGRADPV